MFLLDKKEQTVTHTMIFSYSETPSDVRTVVVRSLVVMHPMAQLFPPALALWLRLSEPLAIFPSWHLDEVLAASLPNLSALRTWYDHRTNLSGYHHCMWQLFHIKNVQQIFLGGGGTKYTWYLAFHSTLCHLMYLEVPNLWHGFSHSTCMFVFIHSLVKRILLCNPMFQQCCIVFWELNMTMYLFGMFLILTSIFRKPWGWRYQRLSLIFYNRYSQTSCKYLQGTFSSYLIDGIETFFFFFSFLMQL